MHQEVKGHVNRKKHLLCLVTKRIPDCNKLKTPQLVRSVAPHHSIKLCRKKRNAEWLSPCAA